MNLAVTAGGSGPLVKATIVTFPREGLSPRATAVRCDSGTTMKVYAGPRLRTRHLLVPDATSARNYRVAVKDSNDAWSEWSSSIALTCGNFVDSVNNVASIGSASSSDFNLEEPAVRFPQFNMGSSKQSIYRTIVSDGFYDEQRKTKWTVKRAAFTCVFADLDESETLLLHKFYRALNGPLTPFWFDWVDPDTGIENRHVVRFRDPSLADELFSIDRSSMEFAVVELVGRVDAA